MRKRTCESCGGDGRDKWLPGEGRVPRHERCPVCKGGGWRWVDEPGDLPEPKHTPPTPAYKLNSASTVAVSTEYRTNKDMTQCPRNVKLYLIGLGGVGVLTEYKGEAFWIEWAALPGRAL